MQGVRRAKQENVINQQKNGSQDQRVRVGAKYIDGGIVVDEYTYQLWMYAGKVFQLLNQIDFPVLMIHPYTCGLN